MRKFPLPVWFLLLAFLALLARMAILLQHGASPFGGALLLDEENYWRWSGRIAGGEWLPSSVFPQGPLYPYLLGAARTIFPGLTPFAVGAAQLLLNWGCCLLLIPLARRWGEGEGGGKGPGRDRAGLAAASLGLLFGPGAFFALKLHAATLGLTLATLALLSFPRPGEGWKPSALPGALLALAALAVPALLLALPLLLLLPLRRRAWGQAAALALAGAVTLLPTTILNASRGGGLMPVSSQLGVTFLQGNNPEAHGTYTQLPGVATNPFAQEATAAALARGESGRELAPGEVSRALLGRGLGFIADDPLPWLALEGKKAALALGGLDVPLESSLARERRDALPLLWLLPLGGTAILLLAALGTGAGAGRFAPLTLVALSQLGAVLLFFAANRYLLPFQFLLLPLAGAGAALLGRRPFPWRVLWRPLPVAACALLSLAPLTHPYFEQLHASRLMALALRQGNPRPALEAFAKTEAAAPAPPFLLRLAARAQAAEGNLPAARAALERALRLDPGDRETVSALAYLLLETGKGGEATGFLKQVVEREPGNGNARRLLGEALLAEGRTEEAEAQGSRMTQAAPFDPAGHLILGVALLRQGKEAEGTAEVMRAAELDPRYAGPWYTLGVHLLDKGDREGARRHLARARSLGMTLPPALLREAGM